MNKNILINLSKINKNGTGMYKYSLNIIRCFETFFSDVCSILISDKILLNTIFPRINIPLCITSSSKISYFKPLLWFLYINIFFKKKFTYIISTTHHCMPIHIFKKQIITIHDMRPYFYPDSLIQKVYFKWILPIISRRMDGIITVSETSKKYISNIYKVERNKIFVIYNVVDVKKFCEVYPVEKEEYLLVVGGTWKHKNIHEIIKYSDLWSYDYKLKIISGDGKYKEYLQELVRMKDLQNRVEFLNYVNEENLVFLYQKASALIYPSIMEGFGIPPLEAMAAGTVSIVSDIEIFREIYGDIPIYVKIDSLESWKKAFEILKNEKIVKRKKLKGLEKVNEYSNERFERTFYSILKKIWPELICEKLYKNGA